MMSLLKNLLRTKVGLLVLGLLLLGSGGTALAMTAGQGPLNQLGASLASNGSTSHTATHTPDAQDQDHDQGDPSGNHLAVEGKLLSATSSSIKVQDDTTTVTISVNGDTKVNGEHASTLADVIAAIGHKVQVQATKQSNGTWLASKVTVQGAEPGTHGQSGNDGEHGQSGTHSQSQEQDSEPAND